MASARPYANAHRSRQITTPLTPAPHHLVFYRPDALNVAQPTVSKHWRHITQKKIQEIKSKIRWKSCEPSKSYVCKHGVRVLHYWGHWQVKKIAKQTLPFDLVIFYVFTRRMLWMKEVDKGCLTIRMGVSGWMFLLVPDHQGSPEQRAVKQLCVLHIMHAQQKCHSWCQQRHAGSNTLL